MQLGSGSDFIVYLRRMRFERGSWERGVPPMYTQVFCKGKGAVRSS